MRLTQEQKNKIILLKSNKTDLEISKELGIPASTIHYWASPEIRKNHIKCVRKYFSKKTDKQKKEYYKSRRDYTREYNNKRYKEDLVFREKQKDRAKKSNKKRREIIK